MNQGCPQAIYVQGRLCHVLTLHRYYRYSEPVSIEESLIRLYIYDVERERDLPLQFSQHLLRLITQAALGLRIQRHSRG